MSTATGLVSLPTVDVRTALADHDPATTVLVGGPLRREPMMLELLATVLEQLVAWRERPTTWGAYVEEVGPAYHRELAEELFPDGEPGPDAPLPEALVEIWETEAPRPGWWTGGDWLPDEVAALCRLTSGSPMGHPGSLRFPDAETEARVPALLRNAGLAVVRCDDLFFAHPDDVLDRLGSGPVDAPRR